MKSTTAQIPLTYAPERLTILLGLFYLWLFMVLDRPQDFFPQLQAVRPALILGCLLVLFFLPQNPAAALKSVLTGRQSRLYVCLLAVMVLGIPFSRYPSRSFHAVFIEQSSNVLLFFFLYALIDSVAKLKRVLFLAVVSAGFAPRRIDCEGQCFGPRTSGRSTRSGSVVWGDCERRFFWPAPNSSCGERGEENGQAFRRSDRGGARNRSFAG